MFKIQRVFLLLIILSIVSCKNESQRAFYYWKSVFKLTSLEANRLEDLNITKLYIRFFDVDWDKETGTLNPKAKIRFKDKVPAHTEIIPVVYITNKSLLNSELKSIPSLADKIFTLIDQIAENNGIKYQEVQIDCDWTDNTKEKYFKLLEVIKPQLEKRDILLSATIRLHQVKYKNRTGVPEVDKGMLMYYNMGKISPDSTTNSIYDAHEASKYVSFCKDYPLPLDVVLPSFSWGIHVRDEKVIELLNSLNFSDFEANTNFIKKSSTTFVASNSFYFRGYYFMKDDVIKIEDISPKDCQKAADQLNSHLTQSVETVAIYHLDSLIINRYDNKEFEKIFNSLH